MNGEDLLKDVHETARRAAEDGETLDVYAVAEALRRRYPELAFSQRVAADTVIAAGLVYGAPMQIDPQAERGEAGAAQSPPRGPAPNGAC